MTKQYLEIMKNEQEHIECNSVHLWGCSIDEQRQNLFDTGAEEYEEHVELFFAYQCLNEIQEAIKIELDGPYLCQEAIQAMLSLSS